MITDKIFYTADPSIPVLFAVHKHLKQFEGREDWEHTCFELLTQSASESKRVIELSVDNSFQESSTNSPTVPWTFDLVFTNITEEPEEITEGPNRGNLTEYDLGFWIVTQMAIGEAVKRMRAGIENVRIHNTLAGRSNIFPSNDLTGVNYQVVLPVLASWDCCEEEG